MKKGILSFFVLVFCTSCAYHQKQIQDLDIKLNFANECINKNESIQKECYELLSERNSFAMLRLGLYHQSKKEYKKALSKYNKVKKMGNYYANTLLSNMYKNALGVKKDLNYSLKLLQDVEFSDPMAAFALYVYYKQDDKEKALELLKFSGEKGYKKAQKVLSSLYKNGELVKVNEEKSQYWLKRYESNEKDFFKKIYGIR